MTDDYVPPAFAEHFEAEALEVLSITLGRPGCLGSLRKQNCGVQKVQYMDDATEFGLALNLAGINST